MMYNKENKIQRSLCFGLNLLAFNLISFSGSILFLSSLNDILQVPHRNRHLITYLSYRKLPENRTNYKLWRDKKLINTGNLCQRNQTATIAKVSPHLLDPILGSPTRPQKQNLSSSFLQIWLGFPSLTWQSTMLCHIMITWHWPAPPPAPRYSQHPCPQGTIAASPASSPFLDHYQLHWRPETTWGSAVKRETQMLLVIWGTFCSDYEGERYGRWLAKKLDDKWLFICSLIIGHHDACPASGWLVWQLVICINNYTAEQRELFVRLNARLTAHLLHYDLWTSFLMYSLTL